MLIIIQDCQHIYIMKQIKVNLYLFTISSFIFCNYFVMLTESKNIKLEIVQFPSFELNTAIHSALHDSMNPLEFELNYKFSDSSLLTITCTSPSPVWMVYDYGLNNLKKVYINQVDQYTHRTFTDFWNTSTYKFKAYMKARKKMIVEFGNISCENVNLSDASENERVNLHLEKMNETLTLVKAWVSPNYNFTSIFDESQNRSCDTRVIVKPTENGAEWSCKSEIDRLLPTKFAYCYSAADCSNILRSVQKKKICVTRLESNETCEKCRESSLDVSKLKQYHSQLVICADGDEPTAALTFFFGFGPNGAPENHKLHLSWSEVIRPEDEMLFIFPPQKTEFKVNQSEEFECHGIQHYFSLGYVFGVQVDNGSIMILPEGGPYKRHELTNARIVKTNITFKHPGNTTVYCFAPVINSTEWINISVTVNVLNADNESEYYYYYDYESAYNRNLTKLKKRLGLNASNSHITGWITIVAIVVGMSALIIIIALISHIRIKRLKRVLIELSESEIREFMDGVVVVSTAFDEACRTWESLPYNNSYEVTKTRMHFEENNMLGAGAYGRVFKGVLLLAPPEKGSLNVAIKTIKPGVDVIYFKALLSELKVMAYLGNGHENIVHLEAACTEGIKNGEIYIAVELCESNLLQVVRTIKNSGGLVDSDCKQYANMNQLFDDFSYKNILGRNEISIRNLILWSYQIADGMTYIADRKVVHGDLSLRNVLITNTGIVKICDFGLARQLVDYNYLKTEQCPLPWKYMAIEALTEMKFSSATDVWAYGITIWELFSLGETPYPGLGWTPDFSKLLKDGLRMSKPELASNEIYQMMIQCWEADAHKRCTFQGLKAFFKSQ